MPQLLLTVSLSPGESLRLDKYISNKDILNRSQIKSRNLVAFSNNKPIKTSFKVRNGDIIQLTWDDPEIHTLIPEKIPLNVLFENKDVIVLDKPQGLVVHPGAGNWSGTLVHGLLYYLKEDPNFKKTAEDRPGIVHRLDKDTSGVIITAKNPSSHEKLSRQFAEKEVFKEYVALVKGRPPKSKGDIKTYLLRDSNNRQKYMVHESRGKWAYTEYRIEKSFINYTLLRVRLHTGRTHQIRVHLKHLGCPIMGDPLYSRKDSRFPEASLMLHALRLGIKIPPEMEFQEFQSPLPERFIEVMDSLQRE